MPKKIKQAIIKTVLKLGNSLAQKTGEETVEKRETALEMSACLRSAAAEGAVLLKNDGALPLASEETVAVFGRVQNDWFYTGYGSGGDVRKPYQVSLMDGLRTNGRIRFDQELAETYQKWCAENPPDDGFWGHWPRFYPEMPVSDELVERVSARCGTAVVVIGRSSGEDRENALEEGSYYLTDEEENLLSSVTASFSRTVVLLNIGSIMDLSWAEGFGGRISAVMIVWQGGMESGNAAADLLCGDVCPNGRLTDTVACRYEDYPSAANFGKKEFNNYEEDIYVGYRWFETFAPQDVLYPFGFGLSYTSFTVQDAAAKQMGDEFVLTADVENTGARPGRETIQLYVEKPCGVLGNPSRILAGFAKTKTLAPGELETVKITVPFDALASYDGGGLTGNRSAYVVEAGTYRFYLGKNVRDAQQVFAYTQDQTAVVAQLTEASAPVHPFAVVVAKEENGTRVPVRKIVPTATRDLKKRILDNLPEGTPVTGDRGIKLADVKAGKATMDDFVAQLSLTELEAISRGDYRMNSPLGPSGNAGALAGVLPSMREKGIPPVITTDGPSGIRLNTTCSLLPIGTLLACTYDPALVSDLYEKVGREMIERGTDVLLAPGMNIHRNPLCGRNFEYYSEDPLVTGVMAAAAVRGLQSTGVSACPKHFACNDQEYNRNRNDSRVSERALREIYLKGFEICVKTAAPRFIMTSYNKINGVWGHYNYELCTTILRGEWNYQGCVMTDWWMRSSRSPEFPSMRDNAYRVRAQVDILMPGGKQLERRFKPDGTLLETYGKPEGITLGEMQRTAKNVLNFALHSTAMERAEGDFLRK